MAGSVNRQITLGARPFNYPRESDFTLVESPVPEPDEGEVLVQTIWLSLDPYMRGRMRAAHAYATPMNWARSSWGAWSGESSAPGRRPSPRGS